MTFQRSPRKPPQVAEAVFLHTGCSFQLATNSLKAPKTHNNDNITKYIKTNFIIKKHKQTLTCQRACMSECTDLWVSETGEQRDDVIHHILIIDDTILTLVHERVNELTEVWLELLVCRPGHYQWIVAAILQKIHHRKTANTRKLSIIFNLVY